MQDTQKSLKEQGFQIYNIYAIRKMSREVLEDFVEQNRNFTNIAIINLSCQCHPIYKIDYKVLH